MTSIRAKDRTAGAMIIAEARRRLEAAGVKCRCRLSGAQA
jgi:hypothetical protein